MFPILIPPLLLRREDIPALVQHFRERKTKDLKLNDIPALVPGPINPLVAYDWPGNVRELENVIERAIIFHSSGPLRFDDFGLNSSKPVNVITGTSKKKH